MYDKYLKKSTVRRSGRYITFSCSIFCIVNIILISIQYKYVNISWMSKGIWRHYPNLSVLAIFVQVLGIILGIIINYRNLECKTLQKIYCIYQLLAIIYVLFVCNFSIICSIIKKNNETLNCNKSLKGFFTQFYYLDDYFHIVDYNLCSENCLCVTNNPEIYYSLSEGNYDKNIIYNERLSDDYIIKFQKCDISLQNNINKYFDYSESYNKIGSVNIKRFYKYWNNIENKFNCIGWCKLNYENTTNHNMKKYLFSNINKGIINESCMEKVTNWISKMILSFGIILYISWFLMVASYVFGFMLCFDLVFEGPNVRIITNENENENENSVEKGEIKPDSQNGIIKGKDNYINFKENNTISEMEKNIISTNIKEKIIQSNIKENTNNSVLDSNKKVVNISGIDIEEKYKK